MRVLNKKNSFGGSMNLCEANIRVGAEVDGFLANVPDAKEESITDYLVWKWRELDQRFKYLSVTTFTRQQESVVTGADFELELWLVGRKYHYPLLFQAKKFVKPYDAYRNKLNYPDGTQGQLSTLLSYAAAKKRIPFYIFYTPAPNGLKSMCGGGDAASTGMFISDAYTVKDFANGVHGKRVSRKALLERSNPFHCMFCCPLALNGRYFRSYFRKVAASLTTEEPQPLPDYVSALLDGGINEMSRESIASMIKKGGLKKVRNVAVYDMRWQDHEPNKGIERTR